MKQLYTRWGKELDCEHVLQEYPRPLLQRDSYINLNGYWDYAITKEFRRPQRYDGRILVPFSPESALSGVNRQLKPDEYLWYRTKLPVDRHKLTPDPHKPAAGCRLLLHFGAVDQACRVYVNGKEAARHTGGYLPFSVDITSYGIASAEWELVLAVRDLSDTSCHARGKQKLKRGGMFYTAQSGIWQTVWMEYVPTDHIQEITAEPDLDKGTVQLLIRSASDLPVKIQIREPALYQNTEYATGSGGAETSEAPQDSGIKPAVAAAATAAIAATAADKIISEQTGLSNHPLTIRLPVIRPWTCDEPYLYYFTVTMGEDQVTSYFALRSFTVKPDQNGIPRICLNGQPRFQNGVLDQGYWPDGLYTAPSDEALQFDIVEMKKMGFNTLRKHIKIEPQRWYYHCDRLGMIVWQDMVNGGSYYKHWFVTYAATLLNLSHCKIPDTCLRLLSRTHKRGRHEFVREMKETIRLLKGHPSIAVWVIFNEGWGQFHARAVTRIARSCDNSRLIDQASGWFDQRGGDLQSIHHYFFRMKFAPEARRATVLSEFGGYSLQIPDHSACTKLYGYGTCKDAAGLKEAFEERLRKVKDQIPEGMCASIYTQLSDVEEEVNGIFTYDREINKLRLQQ